MVTVEEKYELLKTAVKGMAPGEQTSMSGLVRATKLGPYFVSSNLLRLEQDGFVKTSRIGSMIVITKVSA